MKSTLSFLSKAALVGALLTLSAQAQNLTTTLLAQGFNRPVHLTAPPGDTARVFVCEQHTGRVEIVELATGNILTTPFITMTVSTGNEQGLLSMAFHPDYASNGLFYIARTASSGNTRVTEHQVSANPNVGNSAVLRQIVAWNQPFSNHNGGQIAFGPDGYLYVGLGDGGSGNDPGNRAQNGSDLLGKMLRLDVDIASPFIPPSNPFVGNTSVRDEIWSIGLRNPWRFSFDRATGDLWIGDVGQNAWEEINFQAGSSAGGENYGWRCMEGNHCTGMSGCTCNAGSLTDPVHEFNHSGNCSITGGVVYRGSAIPALQGTYFCADYCSNRIWSMEHNGTSVTNVVQRQAELNPPGSASISQITSFGEDAAGEVYILEQGGQIWRITQDCGTAAYCVGAGNTANPSGCTLTSSGSTNMSDNSFSLVVSGAVPNQFGIFFYGPNQTQIAGGNGFICVSGGLFRLTPPAATDVFGSVFRTVDFTAPPMSAGLGAVVPGSTYNFQFWYRDPAAGAAGGATYNFSSGMSAVFCP
jgi:glucose/arabinose dehydrogenase